VAAMLLVTLMDKRTNIQFNLPWLHYLNTFSMEDKIIDILRKSGSAGNQTPGVWTCRQEL
jgi:hypothetical protein